MKKKPKGKKNKRKRKGKKRTQQQRQSSAFSIYPLFNICSFLSLSTDLWGCLILFGEGCRKEKRGQGTRKVLSFR